MKALLASFSGKKLHGLVRHGHRISLLLVAGCLLPAMVNAQSITNTIRFSELSRRSVNGLTFSNVMFGFTVSNTPSSDAYFGGSGPGRTVYVTDPSLEGNARGTLTLDFLSPTKSISFGIALNVIRTNFTPGFRVQLFDPSLKSLGTFPVNTQSLSSPTNFPPIPPLLGYTEAFFSYDAALVSRAIITSFTNRATRFALDNLTYTVGVTSNTPPVAHPQTLTVAEDTSLPITLSATDAEGDPLTYSVTQPAHGTLTGTAPALVYTPATNYFGPDKFTFRANDGHADSAPAEVNITVSPVNDPPITFDQAFTVDEDTLFTPVLLAANDVDGDPLTFNIVTPPAHGTFSAAGYLPATNYFGPDSFTFQVSDGQTNSNIATVSITVRPVNDAPFAKIAVAPLTEFPDLMNQFVIARVCGDAAMVLDGSQSSDVENDPLRFLWTEGTNVLATSATVTNEFAPGTHVVVLTVSDGQAAGTAAFQFEVLTPAETVGLAMGLIEEADLGQRNATPLLASLRAAAASFDRCNTIPAVNQLQAFQNKVRAQIAPSNPALSGKLVVAAQQVINAVGEK